MQLSLQLLEANNEQVEPILDGIPSLLAAFDDALDDKVNLCVVLWVLDHEQ